VEAERDALFEAETRARRDAERASAGHRFLADASKALASSLDLRDALGRVMQLAVPALGDWAAIDLTTETGTMERIASAHRVPSCEAALASWWSRPGAHERDVLGIHAAVCSERTHVADPVMCASDDERERAELIEALGGATWVVIPISAREHPLGALVLASRDAAPSIASDDLALGEELARRSAMAVDNARLYEQARLERGRAEHANRTKDEFLATVSHELRTPLNAISGWAKMLRAGVLPQEKHARAMEIIERNAQIQTQLIDDLLDVSRIVSGKLRLAPSQIAIGDVVEIAVEGVRPQAEAKRITLVTDLAGGAGACVHGDPGRLQQVVWNLLNNAVKFTPAEGCIEIALGTLGGDVVIRVTDSGAGIRSDFLAHVFDRFRQSDSGKTRAHGGLGLGLTIVRHIVELHGGTVEAQSEGEGRGATFIVRIPSIAPTGGARAVVAIARPSLAPTLQDVPRLDGVSVLIVDDESDARELLVSAFQDLEASVTPASSAAEAMSALQRATPDVLVSDIGMPGEDGYALIRRIRALAPERGGRLPAIALTAYAAPEDRARALEEGFDRHLTKPVEPSELAMMIAELTGRATHETRGTR
ncbi:MAG: ATP-binding protein, partial [Myxococcota bacterium]|nr:ATP-binding protein [Myxococcota bacterium]